MARIARWIVGLSIAAASIVSADQLVSGRDAFRSGRYEHAHELLEPMAAIGEPEAQHLMGVMYLLGRGVDSDPQAAFRWLQASASRGNADAQELLSLMYARGVGIERDPVMAYVWIKLASLAERDAHRQRAIQSAIAKLLTDMNKPERKRARKLSREYYKLYVEPYRQ